MFGEKIVEKAGEGLTDSIGEVKTPAIRIIFYASLIVILSFAGIITSLWQTDVRNKKNEIAELKYENRILRHESDSLKQDILIRVRDENIRLVNRSLYLDSVNRAIYRIKNKIDE